MRYTAGVRRALPVLAAGLVLATTSVASGIIRRDDVDDSEYVVPAEAYPAVADLLEPGDCLATLVAPRWAVSAAHCVRHLELPHALTFGDRTVEVAGKVCHPGFDGVWHDIALVHLAEPVEGVAPIPIHRGDDELGQRVIFVGRGDTATGLTGQAGATLDLRTRRATNTVDSVSPRWIRFVFHAPGEPGVTELEGISGDGDSGGPAFIETARGLEVAGLSAYQDASGARLGRYGVTEVYTRVSRYQEFVDEITGDAWDGEYRRCHTCAVAPGAGAGGGWLALGVVAVVLRVRVRRRRMAG